MRGVPAADRDHDAVDRFYREFGSRMRDARAAAGMSQEALGAAISLNRTSIINIEKGRQRILMHQLPVLARVLHTTVEVLLPDAPEVDVLHGLSGADREAIEAVRRASGSRGGVLMAPRAEAAAAELLARLGIEQVPVDVTALAEQCGITVVPQQFGDGDVSGMLLREDGADPVIGVNTTHADVRQRFTVAHELGHWALHPGRLVIFDRPLRVNRRDSVSAMATDREEISRPTRSPPPC